ncbi:ABC transporter substrate-binding protein [Alteribacillus sp. HJP-4]|uniref:ABC transporter substrate-binding protein n=1 Tax=Alteribacillus sp. HJP-4 TaxID=2775394 RepID=UPI0035CCEB47
MKWYKTLAMGTAVASMTFIAACGGNSDEENDTSGEDADTEETENGEEGASGDGEEVTITFARGYDATGSDAQLIEKFEEENPNIKVNYQEMPADTGQQHDQYVTAFSSGSTEIDVFDADVIWPAEFGAAGYAMELDRFIEADGIDLDEYFPSTVEAGQVGGKQYALPKFTDAGLLYYRSDIVDEPPSTWDELIEMAGEYQGEEGTEYGYLMQANQYEGMVVNATEFIGAYGGQVIDENGDVVINSEESIAGLEKMAEIVNAEFVPNDILSFQETETANSYIQGSSVFARNWPYMQAMTSDEEESDVVDNVEFTTLPEGDAGSAAGLGGWMAMISANTEHPEESWEFVKFMSSEESQKFTATEGGRAPTREALYDDEEVKEASPIFANEDFVETLQNAVPRPVSPIYPEISDIMQVEISKVLSGDISAEEAVQNMEEDMNAAMED